MAAELERALSGLVSEHDFAKAENMHISTVRRWIKRGWLIAHKHGRRRDVDIDTTLAMWRGHHQPRRGRPLKRTLPDSRQAMLLAE